MLEKKHFDIFDSIINLVNVFGKQGKYEEVEQMYRQTFEFIEKVLGKEYLLIFINMNNLANVLGS